MFKLINNKNSKHIIRKFSIVPQYYAKIKTEEQNDWSLVVNEAEKIVGYPTSFLNLKFLLSDELANVAFHLRKLIGTSHPLLKTAKNMLLQNDKPTWGLVVLLISKAGGLNKEFSEMEQDISAGVLFSQRALAEVTEMMRTSNIIHKSLLNIDQADENITDLNYGNKIALLAGDYLLTNSFHILATLRKQELNEIISSALRDLSESDFVGLHDKQNRPLPAKPITDNTNDIIVSNIFDTEPFKVSELLGKAKSEWTLRSLLNGGTLLAKSCQGTLMLAGHEESTQELGYIFGRNLALSWQACKERDIFLNNKSGPFSLVSAPVLFHLQHDPTLYNEIEKGANDVDVINYNLIRDSVMNGPSLENTLQLQIEHSEIALNVLKQFPVEDARTALTNIINAMQGINTST